MNMRKAVLCILCSSAVLLCGCKKKAEPAGAEIKSAFPVTINGITFESSPEKAVSLSPALTDIVCDIGAQDSLAGVCSYCDIDQAEPMGSAVNPDTRKIIESGATLVLSSTALSSQAQNTLKSNDITVLECDFPTSLEELENLYASLYAIFVGSADFETFAEDILSSVRSRISEHGKSDVTVLCIVSEYMNVASPDTLCGDIISQLGENAVTQSGGYCEFNEAAVSTPDIILADKSLENAKLPESLNGIKIVYIDLSALEKPNCENIYELVSQMCGAF